MWPQYPNDLVLVVLLTLVLVSPPGFLCQRRLWAGCATRDSAGINGFTHTIHCWIRSELRTDGQDIVAWTEHFGVSWKLISTSADGTRHRREYRRYSMILWQAASVVFLFCRLHSSPRRQIEQEKHCLAVQRRTKLINLPICAKSWQDAQDSTRASFSLERLLGPRSIWDKCWSWKTAEEVWSAITAESARVKEAEKEKWCLLFVKDGSKASMKTRRGKHSVWEGLEALIFCKRHPPRSLKTRPRRSPKS